MENNIDNLKIINKKNSSDSNNNSINFGATVTHIYLSMDDKEKQEYKPKCTSMVLEFDDKPQDVNEIYFKNYYTYIISVLVMKISYNDPKKFKKWYIAIDKKVYKIFIN